MRRALARPALVAVVAVTAFTGMALPALAAAKPVRISGGVNVKGTHDASGRGAATLDVTLSDFSISPTFTKATPGEALTVNIENAGTTTHTFTSKSLGVDVQLEPGASRTIDIPFPKRKGAYVVYCRFHRSSGMQGAIYSKRGAKASDTAEPDAS